MLPSLAVRICEQRYVGGQVPSPTPLAVPEPGVQAKVPVWAKSKVSPIPPNTT